MFSIRNRSGGARPIGVQISVPLSCLSVSSSALSDTPFYTENSPIKQQQIPQQNTQRTYAKKALGQHFLMDRRIVGRILRAAEISPNDTVVEVGPGMGSLTVDLVDQAARVITIEIDQDLASRLSAALTDRMNFTMVTGDARHVDLSTLIDEAKYTMVANLPYYAASPIIRRFLETAPRPSRMVVMVQREVANEMIAQPGKMRVLSVATQIYGHPQLVCNVPPSAFRPSPKVSSSVIRIDLYNQPAVKFDSKEDFFHLVRAAFSSPRKQIHNSLKRGLDKSPDSTQAMLNQAGIDLTRRPQTLSIPEWGNLYNAYRKIETAARN